MQRVPCPWPSPSPWSFRLGIDELVSGRCHGLKSGSMLSLHHLLPAILYVARILSCCYNYYSHQQHECRRTLYENTGRTLVCTAVQYTRYEERLDIMWTLTSRSRSPCCGHTASTKDWALMRARWEGYEKGMETEDQSSLTQNQC